MFGKRKKTEAEKAEQKKKKFLTNKFKGTTKGLPIIGGGAAALAVPLAFVDGGASLMITSAMMGTATPFAVFIDAKNQEDVLYTTDCDQRVFTKGWAKLLQEDLQADLIKTCLKMNFTDASGKKYRKLEERKEKLLEIAAGLEEYLTVIDDKNRPTKEPVAYITKTVTADADADREFYVYPGRDAKKQDAPKPPGQGK